MAETRNYLLGFGERLTEKIAPVKRPVTKADPYQFTEARDRLAPRISMVVREIDSLPGLACPQDECVAAVTLHPAYIAKSFFPLGLFRAVGLEPVGSRPRQIVPEKGAKKPTAAQKKEGLQPLSATADLFVVGKRQAFRRWSQSVKSWQPTREGADELIRVEDVRFVAPAERIKPMRSDTDAPLLEVVLHRSDEHVLEGFRDYMKSLDVPVKLDERIEVQGLCFLPVRVPRAVHERMAQFGFLRVAREMPRLRELHPGASSSLMRSVKGFPVKMPHAEPLNKDVRVAVFDGGIPDNILPASLVSRKRSKGIGAAAPDSQVHGLGVTSALLFGPLKQGEPAPQPYAAVEHYRVVDVATKQDPQGKYFDVLNRIMDVLRQKPFDFVNLSLGPDLPIEDDEVHVWTASLDEHFSHGKSLVTVAAGNTGDADWDLGNARIQAPADGVNMLAVGACDSMDDSWKRADYSSIGPGRSPGIVKPEIVVFGGCDGTPFVVLDAAKPGFARGIFGTSFSSPLALRSAIGVRAYLGSVMSPLALKALLIQHGKAGGFDQREVGWGRVPHEIEELVTCAEGAVHVLYQGELEAGRFLRAKIPIPASGLRGMVTITATFCYATQTDPQDPLNYTRAGLEVAFRPHKGKFNQTERGPSKNPSTKSFFTSGGYETEDALRRDAHKWEPCMKSSIRVRAGSLDDPVFDIHYNARRGGMADGSAQPIPYALVVTVANDSPDLYNKITQRYRTMLEPLRPVIQIPIRSS
jgi:Subtilase family